MTSLSRPALVAALAGLLLLPGLGCRRSAPPAAAPPPPVERRLTLLSGPWRFQASDTLAGAEAPAFDDHAWPAVTVPHTWAVTDPRPYRSAWYRLRFEVPSAEVGRPHYLVFEGVGTLARVFVNGTAVGQHLGAYTRFAVDATAAVRAGTNLLAVQVSNDPRDTADSLPAGDARQLYRTDGGLYRKAWLLRTGPVHVDPLDHAAPGVYLTPREVTARRAILAVRTRVRNASTAPVDAWVRQHLLDREGKEVLSLSSRVRVPAGGVEEARAEGALSDPHLWGPGHPYLYTVRTEVEASGGVVDQVDQRTGFRDFQFKDGAFLLNGEPILLRGIGKHQETEKHASAVGDDEIRADFALLADLGVNLVRLAHYPHAALAYDLADEAGLLVWAENGHSNPNKTDENGDRITREMVRQNYNHPSIVMWSVGNEAAFLRTTRFAQVVREDDPLRVIAYATNVDPNPKQGRGLDLITRNTYLGWYRGDPWDFEEPALGWRYISENGGGSVISSHTDYADLRHTVDAFEPEEWRQYLAEAYDQMVFRDHPRDIPLYSVWILREFRIDKYKGINTKGLVTFAGFKKDAYYLYRAWLRPQEPLVHIASKTYFLRRGRADNGIKAYSNRPELRLAINGEDLGVRKNGEFRHQGRWGVGNVFYWPVTLHQGRNQVVVSDGQGHEDRAVVYFAGPGGRKASPGPEPLVTDLASSNPDNPAWFIDQPVQAQWPFYREFDGSADNTFDELPDAARGASWITTGRLSKPALRTTLRFRLTRPAQVMVLATDGPALSALAASGLHDTGQTLPWRNNDLKLVPARLLSRDAGAGETVTVPGVTADYVVLVKPAETAAR